MEDNLKSFYYLPSFLCEKKIYTTLPMGVLFALEEYGEYFVNYTRLVPAMGYEYVFASLAISSDRWAL